MRIPLNRTVILDNDGSRIDLRSGHPNFSPTLLESIIYIYIERERVTAAMKVETNNMTSVAASLIG